MAVLAICTLPNITHTCRKGNEKKYKEKNKRMEGIWSARLNASEEKNTLCLYTLNMLKYV
jgi:hypothetical protein